MTVSLESRVGDAVPDGGVVVVSHRPDRATLAAVAVAGVAVAAFVAAGAAVWDGGTAGRVGPEVGQSSTTGPIPHPQPQTPPRPDR